MVLEVLKQMGLSHNEASVYIALLTLGKATALQTARQANISRTTTYDVLKALTNKGVIVEFTEGRRAFFRVDSVDMLGAYLHKQEMEIHKGKQAFANIRIELENIHYPHKMLPKVVLHEGNHEVEAMLSNLLATTEEGTMHFICTDYFMEHYGKFLGQFEAERMSNNIELQLLVHDTKIQASLPTDSTEEIRQVRTLVEGHRYDAAMHIVGNTVGFWSAKNNLVVVEMNSPDITSMHKQVFLDLWTKALLQS